MDERVGVSDSTLTDPLTDCRFLLVPGGTFRMGAEEFDGSRPVHPVTVSPFWLGETPVTNAQYTRFVEATGAAPPPAWRKRGFSAPEQPVVTVTWQEAMAFCAWMTKRLDGEVTLPTEAQWELTARTEASHRYPWGDAPEPNPTLAVFGLGDDRRPAPVGSCPAGRGAYGHLDLAGNVWEWCLDAYRRDAYQARSLTSPTLNPHVTSDDPAALRALRGGSYWIDARLVRSAYRSGFGASGRSEGFGFRVALLPARTP